MSWADMENAPKLRGMANVGFWVEDLTNG